MKDVNLKMQVRAFYEECRRVTGKQKPTVLVNEIGMPFEYAMRAYGVLGIMKRIAFIRGLEETPLAAGVVIQLDTDGLEAQTDLSIRYLFPMQGESVLQDTSSEMSCNDEKSDEEELSMRTISALAGKNIVVSGVFVTFPKEAIKRLVVRSGGKLRTDVNKKTSYLICGEQGVGAIKLLHAHMYDVPCIFENQLLNMLEL